MHIDQIRALIQDKKFNKQYSHQVNNNRMQQLTKKNKEAEEEEEDGGMRY